MPFVFGFFWSPQGGSNGAKIASEPAWGAYVLPNMASGRFVTHLGRSHQPNLRPGGGSKEAAREPKRTKIVPGGCWE